MSLWISQRRLGKRLRASIVQTSEPEMATPLGDLRNRKNRLFYIILSWSGCVPQQRESVSVQSESSGCV